MEMGWWMGKDKLMMCGAFLSCCDGRGYVFPGEKGVAGC